jgi:hypothetical protein
MKQKIINSILAFIILLLAIIIWQEYSFRKNLDLKTFEVCINTVPSDILQDYELLKTNIGHCKDLLK